MQSSIFEVNSLVVRPKYCFSSKKLQQVKEYFCLDTLFNGEEDTWQKTLKLQRFVSDNLPHGNPPEYVRELDAIGLWKYTKRTGNHLNCRQHSILMRDMLLSLGIKARHITCLSRDKNDTDAHVVNEVFLPESGRWVMVDSDMDKVVTDLDGNPLSVWELRQMLVSEESYLINGEPAEGQFYDSYMTKNCYWFIRHEISGLGDEMGRGLKNDRWLSLIPKGFKVENIHSRQVFECSIPTTNPLEFWK